MGIIQDKAETVAVEMENQGVEKHFVLDIAMIGVIIGVISDVISIYQACKKTPQEAAVSMRSNGILERWRLRKVIRKHIDDPEMYDHIGQRMFASTLNVSSKLQDDEVQKMYNEVQK